MILTQFASAAVRLQARKSWLGSLSATFVAMLMAASAASGQTAAGPTASSAVGRPGISVAPPRWMSVPTVASRLSARDIGLVINTADPYSVEVGEHYIAARGLTSSQTLRVDLPVTSALSLSDFRRLETAVRAHFGAATQALALAWKAPFAVGCNSITGALTLGYDEGLCANSCLPSTLSPYFNSGSSRPFTDLRLRPSMLLAAKDAAGAIAMIDRGVKSDHTLGLRGGLPVNAYFLRTTDAVRSVRAALFPPPGLVRQVGIDVHVENADALDSPKRVVLYQTGLVSVDKLSSVDWVPGALADHLTSFGGVLDGSLGQMSELDWIASGATATYGTASEPCAHPQKFPHPQVLLLHYVQGSTAIEAYWKSVAWPQQGVFVGEPLASPFSR